MPRKSTRHEHSPSEDLVSNYDEQPGVVERVEATAAVARDKGKLSPLTRRIYRLISYLITLLNLLPTPDMMISYPVDGVIAQTGSIARKYLPSALFDRKPHEYYLMAYNSLNFILWSYLLVLVSAHLLEPTPPATVLNPTPGPTNTAGTASQTLGAYLKNLFTPFSHIKTTPTGFSTVTSTKANALQKGTNYLTSLLHAFVERSRTTYSARGIGVYTFIIQSLALLEVVHSALGLVKSPVQTTAMQVASRLAVVWWFVEGQPTARITPFYTTMLIAWSLSEMIRTTYYTASLFNVVPPRPTTNPYVAKAVDILTNIRYSAFYVLYPLGSGSEYMCMLKGFPSFPSKAAALTSKEGWKAIISRNPPAWRVLFERVKLWIYNWDAAAWTRVPFVFIWPAGLYILMSYMHVQRRKALGRGPGRSINGGRLRDVGGKKRV
ncbi:hypothetical protein PIIN_10030 [Serendipita indica DSM 11827]|uniref:Very-long-chain (3R)-3-hydroxyacyl-CoA dehydratase n=1 Tax=Serendipita indica (strain DSM 11827) TaxID=1109443 RepID=G4TXI7_SERID|nr:hypothetical protein PIIN_10030 [Serendipita indica DSM 11827]